MIDQILFNLVTKHGLSAVAAHDVKLAIAFYALSCMHNKAVQNEVWKLCEEYEGEAEAPEEPLDKRIM